MGSVTNDTNQQKHMMMKPAANPTNDKADTTTNTLFKSFEDMPLHTHLLRGVYAHGFEAPSPIQQKSIVPFVRGGDILAQAQSGTGKTGAFSIGVLQRIDVRHSVPQAVVLAPTRELAAQTHEVLCALGSYLLPSASACQLFVGGTRVTDDLKRPQAGCMITVGTPGRVEDLIKRGALRTNSLKTIVLDEADEMLSQGFDEQVYNIFKYLPKDIQVALFSATVPEDVQAVSRRFMRNPTEILVDTEELSLKGIKQFYVAVDEADKLGVVMDLYESVSIAQSVIFANKREKVNWLAEQLGAHHHTVAHMHSDMGKGDRAKVMDQFRSGSSRVLVSTDLISRGIDVHHVNIVINFDLSDNLECYIHRIGRSGRFGRKGIAINLVSQRDLPLLRQLEAHYKIVIEELPMDFSTYLEDE